MFAECPHALYLYRTAHEEGASADAPERLRRRYIASRSLLSYQYARSAVAAALREFFYYGATDNVPGWVLRKLARDRFAAGEGRDLTGDGPPVLLDPENAEGEVRALLANPFLPELLTLLKKVRPIDKVLVPVPVMTGLADLQLCAAPVLAFREGLLGWFLTFESHASIDTVLCRYALTQLRIPPARVKFLRFNGTVEEAMRLDFSAELDHIIYSARRMYSGLYPRTTDRSVCARCRFRFCCDD